MKLVKLIKICLNEAYSKVHVGKMSDAFPIQNGLKQALQWNVLYRLSSYHY